MAYLSRPRPRLPHLSYDCSGTSSIVDGWPVIIRAPNRECIQQENLEPLRNWLCGCHEECSFIARNYEQLDKLLKTIVQSIKDYWEPRPREDRNAMRFADNFMLCLHKLSQSVVDSELENKSHVTEQSQLFRFYMQQAIRELRYCPPGILTRRDINIDHTRPPCRGGFSEVMFGTWTGQPVAIKRIVVTDEPRRKQIEERESRIWRLLRHPNVLPFLGLHNEDGRSNELCLVSPFQKNGSIMDYLKAPEAKINRLQLLYEVALGIQHLHNRIPQIIHGDIKGNNIFISDEGQALIADFGLSRSSEDRLLSLDQSFHGGQFWKAPELLDDEVAQDTVCSTASDIYAYACTVVEVMTDQHPFPNLSTAAPAVRIKTLVETRPERPAPGSPAYQRGLTELVYAFLTKCWERDRQRRPRADLVVEQMKKFSEDFEEQQCPRQE